jgi:hypothetical protein
MSRLSDEIDNRTTKIKELPLEHLYEIMYEFEDGETISNWILDDIVTYLNEKKTECVTSVLLSDDISLQHIRMLDENDEKSKFVVRNLTYEEAVSLMRTSLRKQKLNKIRNG